MVSEDKRQLLIVRQSQMERALEYYQLIGVKPTLYELVKTAELFKDFVMEGINQDIKNRTDAFTNYITDKQLQNLPGVEYLKNK